MPTVSTDTKERFSMGAMDKVDNKVQELKGEAKEKYGEATGDEKLRAEGKGDQVAGNIKQAAEKVKDAFR